MNFLIYRVDLSPHWILNATPSTTVSEYPGTELLVSLRYLFAAWMLAVHIIEAVSRHNRVSCDNNYRAICIWTLKCPIKTGEFPNQVVRLLKASNFNESSYNYIERIHRIHRFVKVLKDRDHFLIWFGVIFDTIFFSHKFQFLWIFVFCKKQASPP